MPSQRLRSNNAYPFLLSPSVLWADIGQLRQVLSNLFTNAIHAVQGQGTITVTGRFEKYVDSLVIQDTGYGIPPESRALVFEPLFTSKAKGTGLGSTICKQIIERHGGTITLVENGKNGAVGTAFRLCLPHPQTRTSHLYNESNGISNASIDR